MDDDIARAIALSLQEASAGSRNTHEVINIDSDSDDEPDDDEAQMRRAIELSKADAAKGAVQEERKAVEKEVAQPQPAQGVLGGFMSERAQLEKERLERIRRLRGETATPSTSTSGSTSNKRTASEDSEDESDGDESGERPAKSAPGPSVSSSGATGSEGELYWKGELRQIANRHVDPAKDTKPVFRLTEIIGDKSSLSFALMASYCIDWPWLYSFFDPTTPVVVIAQPPPDAGGAPTVKEVLPNWVRTTPAMRAGGYGCQHMKFMLLFYKSGRMRIVITTANSIDYDWRDIENTCWVQDVPMRPAPIAVDKKATDFAATFERVLDALNVEPALMSLAYNDHPSLPLRSVSDLRRTWDFSAVRVQLVASLAGKHEGWPAVIRTGHVALMKAVRDCGARAGKGREVVLECQGSSIGTYSTQWMNEFHYSAQGESAEDWLDQPKNRRAKLAWPPVKIVFPSLQTVRASRMGEEGGGTIFCRKNQWEAAKFPRELFHDSKSKRGPVLMHSKMIIALLRKKGTLSQDDSETESETDSEVEVLEVDPATKKPAARKRVVGWAYVGSHNFTPSAWGNLSGSAFSPTMNITNFELGIVFPLHEAKDADAVACWERPPRKYASGKDRAWIQEDTETGQIKAGLEKALRAGR